MLLILATNLLTPLVRITRFMAELQCCFKSALSEEDSWLSCNAAFSQSLLTSKVACESEEVLL